MKKILIISTLTNLILWGSAFATPILNEKTLLINDSMGAVIKFEDDIIFPAGKDNSQLSDNSDVIRASENHCDWDNWGSGCERSYYLRGTKFSCSAKLPESSEEIRIIPKGTLIVLGEIVDYKESRTHGKDNFTFSCRGQYRDKTSFTIKASFINSQETRKSFNISCVKEIYFADRYSISCGHEEDFTPESQRKVYLNDFIMANQKVFSF